MEYIIYLYRVFINLGFVAVDEFAKNSCTTLGLNMRPVSYIGICNERKRIT